MNMKKVARELVDRAGLDWHKGWPVGDDTLNLFEVLVILAFAHEREECAKLCDRFQARDVGMQPAECAGAIRARSKA
jgi:hypothetical protein